MHFWDNTKIYETQSEIWRFGLYKKLSSEKDETQFFRLLTQQDVGRMSPAMALMKYKATSQAAAL